MTHIMKIVRNSLSAFARKTIGTTSYNCNSISLYKGRRDLRSPSTCSCDGNQPKFLINSINIHDYQHRNDPSRGKSSVLFGATFAFLGFFEKKEEEEEENPLITTLKRSILLIQKEDFKKAEQMLHLALRQAQTVQNEDGITYVYDIMANLAFQVGEYDKAQKLFKSVMQRELAKGTPQDDLKIVHMSLKMAKILENKGEYENAETGYKYCTKILQNHIDSGTDDTDILTLWAMNLDWYAHLLLTMSRFTEAMKYMEKAYEFCVKVNGELHEQCVVLLNDLGSICFSNKNYDEAADYLVKAVEIGDKIKEMEDLSSIYTNLGNVYIKKGLLDEAKRSCSKGWKLSRSKKNYDTMGEAKACLEEINKLLTK